MMGWIDTKRPPTFSVGGLTHGMGFSDFAREQSAPADCFRCKVRWDSCYGSARDAAPCTERSDAKQPGLPSVRAVCLAERTYSRQESIEVRPLFQRDCFDCAFQYKRLPPSRMAAFYNAEFRRIYGVVFRALLHGEATVYLLIVGTTICCIRSDHCSQITI